MIEDSQRPKRRYSSRLARESRSQARLPAKTTYVAQSRNAPDETDQAEMLTAVVGSHLTQVILDLAVRVVGTIRHD